MAEFIDYACRLGALRGRPIATVLLPGDSPPPTALGPRRCVCGRQLRDPVSRARGYGPKCWRRLRGDTTTRRTPVTPPAAPAPVIDGQTELPLAEHQPTLWSL
ncbi:DUF6011 domain-containing protein [Streptomyces sp. Q6]|uniref:DUF6011 domain-containing protein n=1 Tax=Streptomyces citrinus TaxID=3118173 RepID=A0ACD5AG02_9ACTN